MKNKKIVVLETVHLKPDIPPDTKIIPIGELGDWIRSGKIFSHLFQYEEAIYYVSDFEKVIRPFLCCFSLKLLSRGKCVLQDSNGSRRTITLFFLFRLFIHFLKEWFQIPFCLWRHSQAMKHLEAKRSNFQPSIPDLTLPPLYMRSDRAVGLLAGGMVSHTIGVLNNLEHFTARPFFVTTVKIPTVDPNIEFQEIELEKHFRNFDIILLLESTNLIFKETLATISDKSFAFVYQRYSIYNYSGLLLAEKFKVPLVLEFNDPANWTQRNWAKGLRNEQLAQKIEMLNVSLADVVVVVSRPLRDILVDQGINPDKILVNPNGVDTDIYTPDLDGTEINNQYGFGSKTVIGFIGTFGRWHGAEVLARAYGQLIKENPAYRKSTHLLMVGDGTTMPQVKQEIAEFNIEDHATLTGIIPQVDGPKHLAACDILISSQVPNADGTPFFGSPIKLFEYMAMGKGIVASDLDQVGEILQHNRTAWMVPPADPDSLMAGIKTLIEDPELRDRLGRQARQEAVSNHTWKEHTRKIIEKLKERCHY